ncbi:MAG: hypothetical protein MUO50_04575, partial [Longimicrobiales bacterium]|nr:hypothetical protein [Longimicrobiales bacterium]
MTGGEAESLSDPEVPGYPGVGVPNGNLEMHPEFSDTRVLGLDVGAVSLSAAEVDRKGEIVRTFYLLHHGEVEACLERVLDSLDLSRIGAVAATTSTPSFIRADHRFDNQICLITAGRRFHPEARSILVVGGERFGLVRFDAHGAYLSFKGNPLCAAGTGSFLDQQAQRLNLESIQGLTALALANDGPTPKIASRCAVFAKTDLVHAQQEGHSLESICDGLCGGVAKNIVDTLFTGEVIHGPLLLVGGVAKNPAVVRRLRALLGVEIVVDGELPHGAVGAALKLLRDQPSPGVSPPREVGEVIDHSSRERAYEHPPLEIRLSQYPDFESLERSVFTGRFVEHSHPLEVDLYRPLDPGGIHEVYLGIDI